MEGSVKIRFASKIVNNIIALTSNVILGFVLPRSLGPMLYGNYSLAYDMISQTLSFLEVRSFTFFYNKLSANYKSRYLTSYTLLTIGLIFIVAFTVGVVYYTGLNNYILKDVPLYITLIALTIVIQKWLIDFFTRIYDALGLTILSEKYKTTFSIVFILLTILALFLNQFSLFVFFSLNLLAFVPLLLLLFFKFEKYGNASLIRAYSFRFSFRPIWNSVTKYCSPFLIYLVLQFIITILDRNLLQLKRGSYEQGLYGFSLSLMNIIMILISAITPIFLREIAILNKLKDKQALCTLYNKVVPSFFILVCYFVAFIMINADDVIILIGGEKYGESRILLMICMFSTLAACYTNFNNCILYVLERFGYTSRLIIYTFPLSLTYSLLLVYYFDYGSIGLALKNTISEFVMLFLIQVFLSKELGLGVRKHFLFLFYIFVLFSGMALFVNYLCALLPFDHVLTRLFFKGGLYTLLVAIIYFLVPSFLMIGADFGYRIDFKGNTYFRHVKSHEK